MGYRPNGTDRLARDGSVVEVCRFTMDREDFAALRRDDIEIVGAEETAALFGTEQAPEGQPSGS
jgi:hypothetical protein